MEDGRQPPQDARGAVGARHPCRSLDHPIGVDGMVDPAGRRIVGPAPCAAGGRRADPAPERHLETQPCARRRQRHGGRGGAGVVGRHVPRPPGVADGRRHRPHAGAAVDHAETPARVADGGSGESRPRSRPARLLPTDGRQRRAGRRRRRARRHRRAWRGMDRRPVRGAVARGAVDRAPHQPARRDLGTGSIVRSGRRRVAARRPSHVAVLRDVRRHQRTRAAARQLPGRPATVDRPSHVAHQHRHLPVGHRQRPRLRMDRHGRHGRTLGGHAGDRRSARTIPRPSLQLVRHADAAAVGARVRLDGRQRQPRGPPARRFERLSPVRRSAVGAARRHVRHRRCAGARRETRPARRATASGIAWPDSPEPHDASTATIADWSASLARLSSDTAAIARGAPSDTGARRRWRR